ncbi:MAG: hypothetical protein ACQESG_05890 [Nanobdellota archaeon]
MKAQQIDELFGYLGEQTPEQAKAFGAFMGSAEKDGISAKIKEAP